MKKDRIIQIKAFSLLAIFGLNLLVSFVCAIGLNTALYTDHHVENKTTTAHVHKDGVDHHHDTAPSPPSQKEHKDDNCCSDEFAKFTQVEKSIPQDKIQLLNLFSFVKPSLYFVADILWLPQTNPSTRYFVRSYHPPIEDIRIAIQSFQI